VDLRRRGIGWALRIRGARAEGVLRISCRLRKEHRRPLAVVRCNTWLRLRRALLAECLFVGLYPRILLAAMNRGSALLAGGGHDYSISSYNIAGSNPRNCPLLSCGCGLGLCAKAAVKVRLAVAFSWSVWLCGCAHPRRNARRFLAHVWQGIDFYLLHRRFIAVAQPGLWSSRSDVVAAFRSGFTSISGVCGRWVLMAAAGVCWWPRRRICW